MKSLTQDISFVAEPRRYILHNGSNEPIELQYDAGTKWVPPVDTLDPNSGKDEDGTPIPGTLVVEDVFRREEGGGETLIWNASNAVMHWLGLDVSRGEAVSLYAKRGLSLLPMYPDKALVEEVVLAGIDRAKTFKLQSARQEILAYDQQNFARKSAGASPLPPTSAYENSIALIQAYADEAKSKAVAALKVGLPKEAKAQNVVLTPDPPKRKPGRPAKTA